MRSGVFSDVQSECKVKKATKEEKVTEAGESNEALHDRNLRLQWAQSLSQ